MIVTATSGHEPSQVAVEDNNGQVFWNCDIDGDVNLIFGRVRRSALLFDQEHVRRERATYVPADGHHAVVAALRTHQGVVLTGNPGDGRDTVGVVALGEVLGDPRVHRLAPDSDGDLGLDHPGQPRGDGYLFPIGRSAESGLASLAGVLARVRELASGLVVITDEVTAARVEVLRLGLPVVRPARPDPLLVYGHHLPRELEADGWAAWPEAHRLLAEAAPADAVRLAHCARAACSRRPGDLEAQRRDAGAAYGNWTAHLADWFVKHPGLHEQVLLLAVAALQPISADGALRAAAELAKALDIPSPGGGLAWPFIGDLHTLLGTEDGEGGLRFTRADYASSVLRHVWHGYPLARTSLFPWLAELPLTFRMSPETLDRLVESFVDLAARHGDGDIVADTVQRWLASDAVHIHAAAVDALGRASIDHRVGGRVRRRMYDWSRTARLSPVLKLATVDACAYLGQVHPSYALTRLKHLATRGNRQVRDEVLTVAEQLAGGEAGRVMVCAEAVRWTNDSDLSTGTARQATGAELFLRLAEQRDRDGHPSVLTGVDTIRPRDTLSAWVAVLRLGVPGYEAAVGPWLDAATERPALRAEIVRTLLEATRATWRFGRLAGAAENWYAGRHDEASRAVYAEIAEGVRAPQRTAVSRLVRRICDWMIRVFRF